VLVDLSTVNGQEFLVFPIFDLRSSNLVLGLAIGFTFALACHWVNWLIR